MTPPVLESMKTLAGICNAERISEDVKKEAETCMKILITVIKNEADKMRNNNSPIMVP